MSLLNILSQHRFSVPYRPAFGRAFGCVTSAVVFLQMVYYADASGGEFYKFATPSPKNPKYRKGDSWEEELAIDRKAFFRARDKFCVPISNSSTEEEIKQAGKALFSYRTDNKRVTYYTANKPAIEAFLKSVYSASPDIERGSLVNPEMGRRPKSRNGIYVNPEMGRTRAREKSSTESTDREGTKRMQREEGEKIHFPAKESKPSPATEEEPELDENGWMTGGSGYTETKPAGWGRQRIQELSRRKPKKRKPAGEAYT